MICSHPHLKLCMVAEIVVFYKCERCGEKFKIKFEPFEITVKEGGTPDAEPTPEAA